MWHRKEIVIVVNLWIVKARRPLLCKIQEVPAIPPEIFISVSICPQMESHKVSQRAA